MWNFINKAKIQVDDLVDEVRLADTTFTEVIGYYGEEDNRNMNSSEFYGIFKTFVTSYKACHFLVSEKAWLTVDVEMQS